MYDVVIIGSGPGGYVAAIRAAHHGLKTLVVEETHLGGVCLNVGCIPSKALIHAGHVAAMHKHSARLGIEMAPPTVHWDKVQKWRADIVSRLTKGIERLVAGRGAEIRMGRARLAGPGAVEITDGEGRTDTVQTKKVILATGSRPVQIGGFEFADSRIWDSTRALESPEIPERLSIIGGGVIGLELGQVYANFGAKVAVVEMMDQILPGIPKDVLQPLQRRLRKQGISVLTEAKAQGYEERDGALVLHVDAGGGTQEIPCDRVLVTVGRKPNTEDLGLDTLGIDPDSRGFIAVNERLETGVDGVYAIGDITGQPLLAHRASKQGEACADILAGEPSAYDSVACPAVVYTDPEIAVTGLSEADAKEQGYEVISGKFPFAASGRAMSMNDTTGFIKVVADRDDGALLGVQAVGPNVSELITEGTLAVEMGAQVRDLALTIHPHPSLSEGLMEAALVALGEAVHVMPR